MKRAVDKHIHVYVLLCAIHIAHIQLGAKHMHVCRHMQHIYMHNLVLSTCLCVCYTYSTYTCLHTLAHM